MAKDKIELDINDVSPQAVIDKVQKSRLILFNQNDDDIELQTNLLTGLATTAVQQLRISSEDANSKEDQKIAAAMVNQLSKLKVHPFLDNAHTYEKIIPEIPDTVVNNDEMFIGLQEINYDDV